LSDKLVAAASPANAAQAQAAGQQLELALRQAFSESIVVIYWITAWLAGIALLLVALYLPDVPLRKSNRPEQPLTLE